MKRITTHLLAQLGSVTIPCELYFHESDPFAVAFIMNQRKDLTTWWTSRETLEQAVFAGQAVALGDVGFATTNQSLTMTIKPPHATKTVRLVMPKTAVWLFLIMVNRHCPYEKAKRITSQEIDQLILGLG